jgi:hypothetical protein
MITSGTEYDYIKLLRCDLQEEVFPYLTIKRIFPMNLMKAIIRNMYRSEGGDRENTYQDSLSNLK